MRLKCENIKKLARYHIAKIVQSVQENRTSLIVELHRFNRDRVRERIECIKDLQREIDQEVWCEVVTMKNYRSDRAGWVLA
jgi:hypothetical protein